MYSRSAPNADSFRDVLPLPGGHRTASAVVPVGGRFVDLRLYCPFLLRTSVRCWKPPQPLHRYYDRIDADLYVAEQSVIVCHRTDEVDVVHHAGCFPVLPELVPGRTHLLLLRL